MPQRLLVLVNWTEHHFWNIFWALIAGFFNYFIEIREVVYVMLFAFGLDLVLGICSAIIIHCDRFRMKKFFIALMRLAISILVIMLLFAMGKEMGIGKELYNLAAWIIAGAFGYSAVVNGYKLTGGKVLLLIKETLNKKIKDNTGINMDKIDGGMYDND